MRKIRLFGNHIDVNCEYCAHSTAFDGACVCQLGKYLTPEGTCRRFSYDPLKRTPTNLPPLKSFDADDFKL